MAKAVKVEEPSFISGSSNEKPVTAVLGTIYYEVDTGHRLRFNNDQWNIIDNINKK
jgi:hypothetical protein